MRYTTDDIFEMHSYLKNIIKACAEIEDGKPISRSLADNGVSSKMFDTVLEGVRRKKKTQNIEIVDLRHASWQDELLYDVCGEEVLYIPPDFEDKLDEIEKKYLTDDEINIIDEYYKNRKSIKQIAKEQRISEPTVINRKRRMLRTIRKFKDEIVYGKKYMDKYKELKTLYEKRINSLRWMDDAVKYIDTEAEEEIIQIDDVNEITNEACDFYRDNGFFYLADVMKISLKDLFVMITETADHKGVFFSITGEKIHVGPDTSLKELGFNLRTLQAFENQNLYTVRDVLMLKEDEIDRIPGVGVKQIVRVYRKVLFS